jgi:histidinol dehydrogenase
MLRIVDNVEIARSSFMKRVPQEEQDIPDRWKEKIRELFGEDLKPQQVVERILDRVRHEGDEGLFFYSERIDGMKSRELRVTEAEIEAARQQVGEQFVAALNLAAERIRAFHSQNKPQSWIDVDEGGLGQRLYPLDRVGVYVPGGTACYPSTLLMTCIPARVAGVREIIVTVPPSDGVVAAATLAAAHVAGVSRIYKVGGAQAIAALAFGTESIPKVDKICGPGNIFVQLAKKQVYGEVDIDGLYGPTELVIVADETADPAVCAADLLAQAEHDPLAAPILITTSAELAAKVQREVEKQLGGLERHEIIALSLEDRGGIVVVADMDQAAELVNGYAPEHLSLMMSQPWEYLDKIKHAGAVFIGEDSPQAVGDYVAGPSHVLPTGGTARFGSPLRTEDFLKATSLLAIDKETLGRIGPSAAAIARCEGLSAHARAIEIRLAGGSSSDSQ